MRDIENDVPTPKVIERIRAETLGSFQLRVRLSSEQKQAGIGEGNRNFYRFEMGRAFVV